jgi:hypothetical protein
MSEPRGGGGCDFVSGRFAFNGWTICHLRNVAVGVTACPVEGRFALNVCQSRRGARLQQNLRMLGPAVKCCPVQRRHVFLGMLDEHHMYLDT